ncbi:YaiI/YqxD family protein [Rheinheimera sp. 4Y26]|uniref:YaiI/YqxD family protein n=1 Tax=Rheinheimera sp. 4Y26 TaxID=2977811 RepID=UPI0021B094BC|nr:YaiI/YqxD family protein [Rheinheimera sp. 4Y26]MCT6699131.1 YaiI/YqxD family protein [Rheinheimera sp. 4Y26]
MPIWIDADACPKVCRDMLCRAGERTATSLIFVSNHPIPLPKSPLIKAVHVPSGFDVADNKIAADIMQGDLLITQDIPLAAAAIAKGALVITPRGDLLDKNNIGERLTLRNFQEELRGSGLLSGGPAALDNKDKQKFGNALDKYLSSRR